MSRPLPKFVGIVVGKFMRAHRAIEAGTPHTIARRWLDLLTTLGLLNQIERKPPVWAVSEEGRRVLESVRQ